MYVYIHNTLPRTHMHAHAHQCAHTLTSTIIYAVDRNYQKINSGIHVPFGWA